MANVFKRNISFVGIALGLSLQASAQTATSYTSTDNNYWTPGKVKLQSNPKGDVALEISDTADGTTFKKWGATFNELDWDALMMLPRAEQDKILSSLFSPEGDLRLTRGRISLGANDYARSWYSCDETQGDLELRHFNIDRDRQAIIPFIKAAQSYCPGMTFWISPWSPPSWMKINNDYPVLSNKYNHQSPEIDYLLYSGKGGSTDADEMKLTGDRSKLFPRQLATTDYFIQDPRYLKAYAEYFCKFIDAYRKEGIPIDMVMYQNEAYSYTPYPGCAWTAPSIQRFNRDYLSPALKERHPGVKLYLGTFNTNRVDHVNDVLSDPALCDAISGIGFQWEGRESLPEIRKNHPEWSYICSESECGWGSFDFPAAEHTFELINHYLGNGCDEYNFWNVILADNGESPWGWKQNALIRVDSKGGTATLTPEYYAARHYSNFLPEGSKIVGHSPASAGNIPVLAAVTPDGYVVVIAGNLTDNKKDLSVKLGSKYLNVALSPHSFNTYRIEKKQIR